MQIAPSVQRIRSFLNIGSTLVDLGNNFATTEKPIIKRNSPNSKGVIVRLIVNICSKYLEAHESLWRELSVAMLLVSQAVRPYLGIRHAVKRWETTAVALAERLRSRVNMIAALI